MTSEPSASAEHAFWVVDRGSNHAGKTSLERLHAAWKAQVAVAAW